MDTRLLHGDDPRDIRLAGEILRNGGLVAIPTETVYGLAANALNPEAVKKIYAAKGRPADNPLIVHICDLSQWAPLVRELPEAALRLAEAFWPGPLTIILPRSSLVPDIVSAGLPTVSVRFPAHPAAQAVIRAAGVPLAAPSANLSGRPSPTRFAHVQADLTGRVDALLDGGDCGVGVESTVLTLAEGVPRLLRPGGVTLEALRAVLGRVELDPAVAAPLPPGEKPASPGMKYRHYAPRAKVTLVDASPEEYSNYVNKTPGLRALCFAEDLPLLHTPGLSYGSRYDGREQAKRLFAALHRLDGEGDAPVAAHLPSRRGVGLAVYNRLLRAAVFSVVNPTGRTVLGLTGPSGAGKSTVGAFFRERGWFVLDCDDLTRSPAVYDGDCLAALKTAFGEDVAPKGVLDRKLLAARAFSSPERKARLEAIVFPKIFAAIRQALPAAFAAGRRVAVLDAPTLFEAGADRLCGRIVAVTAPLSERVRRVCDRDGVTEAQALLRMNAQPGEDFYASRADYVLENGPEGVSEEALRAVLLETEKELEERTRC